MMMDERRRHRGENSANWQTGVSEGEKTLFTVSGRHASAGAGAGA